jgi:hypothetical protein
MLRADPLVRMLGHTTVVLALLTLAYYVLPLRLDRDDAWQWGRLATSVIALVVLGSFLRRSLRRSSRVQATSFVRIQWLLSLLYLLVLAFALLYAAVAVRSADQFVGLENRTDALYFSVTIVATVGFGDIHASGTLAKVVVTAHMLFNLVYLGTALRMLTSRQGRFPTDEE